MKVRILIAGAAVVLLCGGVGICTAEDAPAPSAAPKVTHSSAPKRKHHRKTHHGNHHAQEEFSEQQLQQMQAQPPSK
jgi:hypothetical protein